MKAFDFTTYQRDLSVITRDNLAAMKAQGYQHAIIGMDSASTSVTAVRAILDAGLSWDAYRYLYASRGDPSADIADIVAGVLAVYRVSGNLKDLPGVIWLDVEKDGNGAFPTQSQVSAAMAALAAHQVGPGNIVQAGVYSGAWVWQGAGWGNWSVPAAAGYWLWANADTPLWGGWSDDLYAGYQTDYNQNSPIGLIDSSTMRDRTVALLKQPF